MSGILGPFSKLKEKIQIKFGSQDLKMPVADSSSSSEVEEESEGNDHDLEPKEDIDVVEMRRKSVLQPSDLVTLESITWKRRQRSRYSVKSWSPSPTCLRRCVTLPANSCSPVASKLNGKVNVFMDI